MPRFVSATTTACARASESRWFVGRIADGVRVAHHLQRPQRIVLQRHGNVVEKLGRIGLDRGLVEREVDAIGLVPAHRAQRLLELGALGIADRIAHHPLGARQRLPAYCTFDCIMMGLLRLSRM